MSGHSKWSQIKHKKALVDAKKGASFGKIARAISIAAKGNPDPATNLRLKGEIEKARAANMPNDNIERAIKRVGEKDAESLTDVQLEGIGPGGVAIIVRAITDNSNRTINELKQLLGKFGSRMTGPGSVAWMFTRTEGRFSPTTTIPLTPEQHDQLMALVEALDGHDDVQEVYTNEQVSS